MTKIGIADVRGALRGIFLLTATIGGTIFTSAFAGAQMAPASPSISVTPAAVPTQTPTFNGIAHIAIRVKDIAASVAFYNKLGFQQAFAMTAKDGSVSQSFIKINDRQFIEIYPVGGANTQVGFMHLCFEGADLNALHDFYVSEGLEKTTITVRKAAAGNLLFTMKGPMQVADPQNIEYTQYMPGSLHSNDFGQHLGADRVGDKMVVVTLAMQDPTAARAFYNDKMQFVPVDGGSRLAWRYGLPGSSKEAVEIVPVESLGAKSSIVLTSPDIRKSGELLNAKGVGFTDGDMLTVTDPDGNLIHLAPQPGTFKR